MAKLEFTNKAPAEEEPTEDEVSLLKEIRDMMKKDGE